MSVPRGRRALLTAGALWAVACTAVVAAPAGAASGTSPGSHLSLGPTATFSVPGVAVSGTPARYDHVMVRRFGSPSATNVLVLVPGTLAGAADFDIVGPYLASHVPDLQVWAEMRREGALQDDTELRKLLAGKVTLEEAGDYYVGWLTNPSITDHYQPLDPADYRFVDQWGLAVAMGDLHDVIERARDGGRRTVILGGHSLGGAEASIYAAWDFDGRGGYRDIAGIVGIDGDAPTGTSLGGSSLTTAAQAGAALAELQAGSPWLDLFGIGDPWLTGALAELGAIAARKDPDAPSIAQQQIGPLLQAAGLAPPEEVTNAAQLGYAFDAATSPAALSLIHVHAGHLAAGGTPRGWVDDGPTPVQDIAFAFSQEPLGPVDWYYPERLTIDVQAAASLTETPAAQVFGLRLTHLSQVDVPMYVIQTSLGGSDDAVAQAAVTYQRESRIPSVTVVNKASTYGHLDPLLATPSRNAFLRTVVPWIEHLPAYRR